MCAEVVKLVTGSPLGTGEASVSPVRGFSMPPNVPPDFVEKSLGTPNAGHGLNRPSMVTNSKEIAMLEHTAFSFATASPEQTIAFIGGAIAHIAFFAWVAYLALR